MRRRPHPSLGRLGPALIALCLLLSARAVAGAARPANPATTTQEVAEGLTCQCGCGLTVANCNHPSCSFAVPVKDEIGAMISRDMSKAAVLASFRHKYGEKVLSAPTTEGFNMLAWTIPFIALLVGAALILLTIRRWKREPRLEDAAWVASGGAAGDGAQEFDPRLRRQLERELRERL